MKRFFLLLLAVCVNFWALEAQDIDFNLEVLGHKTYAGAEGSSCWGYTHPDGTEYAIMGLTTGTSIVSLADPTNPTEVKFFTGPSGYWREMKVWNNYAYIGSDEGSVGILIVDLNQLPSDAPSVLWKPTVTLGGSTLTITRAHTVTIDENGYLYLNGVNVSAGQTFIFDMNANPTAPVYKGAIPTPYIHDSFVRNDTLWGAAINDGQLYVVDVSNKANPTILGVQTTPFEFAHNAWLTGDGKTCLVTEEVENAPITAYDVSDVTDVKEVASFVRTATANTGVIAHNVHIINDFAVTAYYSDGVVIIDTHRPKNLVEVAHYDTYLPNVGGFHGVWGVYPYFPSGTIIASDIESGLWVFKPTYTRACYLEGKVTDAANSQPINGATITVQTNNAMNRTTDIQGLYYSGTPTPGQVTVTVSKFGYISQSQTVTLVNGQVTELNVALQKAASFSPNVMVLEQGTNVPIANAQVELNSIGFVQGFQTNTSGSTTLSSVPQATYTVYVGKWGYKTIETATAINNNNALTFYLEKGYADPFALPLGWTVSGTATTGAWERGEPVGTSFEYGLGNCDDDIPTDVGDKCYVTGNGGGAAGDDDIDNGTTTLTSPIFDATGLTEPTVSYYLWFFNDGGQGSPNDSLNVYLSNGQITVPVEKLTSATSSQVWRPRSIKKIADYLAPTATMRLLVTSGDYPQGHLVEAGIDDFELYDAQSSSSSQTLAAQMLVRNSPFTRTCTLDYYLPNTTDATLQVTNMLGQILETHPIAHTQGSLTFGETLPSGIFVIHIVQGNQQSAPVKILKL
jgi:choice-of-anchor B domain-containing protein